MCAIPRICVHYFIVLSYGNRKHSCYTNTKDNIIQTQSQVILTYFGYDVKKSLKIPKGQSESVYRRKTDNTMVKRKSTKGQTIDKTTRTPLKTGGELMCCCLNCSKRQLSSLAFQSFDQDRKYLIKIIPGRYRLHKNRYLRFDYF